jgi:hypothetical protein
MLDTRLVFRGLSQTTISLAVFFSFSRDRLLRDCSDNWLNSLTHFLTLRQGRTFPVIDAIGVFRNLHRVEGLKHKLGQDGPQTEPPLAMRWHATPASPNSRRECHPPSSRTDATGDKSPCTNRRLPILKERFSVDL